MQDFHNQLQKYFEELLLFYGFNARKEFEVPSGRIDLAGFREDEDLSIGIEITRTSDALRDASKLTEYPFNLRFIVVDDLLKDKFIISTTRGEQIIVVYYQWFENELRRALNIPPSGDRFVPFDEWFVMFTKLIKSLESESGLSKFVEHLKTSGLDKYTEELRDTLTFIYTAGEVPSQYISVYCAPGMEYGDFGFIDSKILSILGGYNIISRYSRGNRELRKYYVHVSNLNLAKQVVMEKIKENEESLNDLIQKYGDKAFIIARGTKPTEGYLKLDVVPPPKELYQKPQTYEEITYSILYSKRVPVKIAERVCSNGPPIDLITRYCYFLTYSSLYDTAVKFFQELKSLNLAVKMPTYDSYGQYKWDEYRASEEVADCVLSRARYPNLDEFAVRFGVLAIIAWCSDKHPSVARSKFNELLRTFEIPLEKAEEELNKLNELGMTSKLIQEGETSPFIVLEPDAFKGYIKRELEKLLIT